MKYVLIVLSALALVTGVTGCGKSQDKKPVYKFTAKVNGSSWATDMVEPSTTPTEATYISSLYYYSAGKQIYVNVRNPKTSQTLKFYVFLENYSTAVGTYTRSSGRFEPEFLIANNDDPTNVSTTGSFEITKFTYDANLGKITSLSGKFSFKQTAEHWDGNARTIDVTEGELNNVSESN
ncbi:MAG TPA: hypothetical protein VL947_10920 [Cytophagales bacterium]|nr:hypothetical protein [Cytophagales bacterium]